MISCLRGAGVEVIERHANVWERQRHKWSLGLAAALRIGLAETRLLFGGRRERFDAVIVGYPGHFDVPAARRIARGRPVVFNPLVSLHETLVEDRGRFSAGSPAAGVLRQVDRLALRRADLVVADTAQNARHLAELAELPTERLAVCFVGAEERLFRPGWQPPQEFHALFVGKLIPLHGVETILAAARLAPEIPFRIVGSGQLDGLLAERPPNVEWVEWVEYEHLPEELQRAGCALGVFGTSAKTGRVIPNKAFQALACGTPLVTADTPAAARAARRRRERAAGPRRRRRGAGGGGAAAGERCRACAPDRRRRAARPTGRRRARRCSASGGGTWSSSSSRDDARPGSSGSPPLPSRPASARWPSCGIGPSAAAASISGT